MRVGHFIMTLELQAAADQWQEHTARGISTANTTADGVVMAFKKTQKRLSSISKRHYMGVVLLRPQQCLMFYLCDSEELISDSVACASAMRDFVIQHLEESLGNKHQK